MFSSPFFQVGVIGVLAASSPGPDMLMVARSSLAHGRRCGVASSAGLALGVLIHSSYCIAGLAFLVATTPGIQRVMQYCGAVYLVYLGVQCLRQAQTVVLAPDAAATRSPKLYESFLTGLFTNLLNPKVTLFVLSVFTQFVHGDSARSLKVMLALELALVTVIWFSLLAFGVSYNPIRKSLLRWQAKIDRLFGITLICVGAWVFWA